MRRYVPLACALALAAVGLFGAYFQVDAEPEPDPAAGNIAATLDTPHTFRPGDRVRCLAPGFMLDGRTGEVVGYAEHSLNYLVRVDGAVYHVSPTDLEPAP